METLEAQPSSKTRMNPGFSRGRDTRPFAHTRAEINAPRGEIPVAKPRLVCARPTGATTTTAGATTYGGFVGSRFSLPAPDTRQDPLTHSAPSAMSTLSSTPTSAARVRVVRRMHSASGLSGRVAVAGRGGISLKAMASRNARAARVQTGRVVSPAASSRPEPPRAVSGADLDAFIADVAADKSKAVQVRAR